MTGNYGCGGDRLEFNEDHESTAGKLHPENSEDAINDLRQRLSRTRFPDQAPGSLGPTALT
jgi:hypothetical protein